VQISFSGFKGQPKRLMNPLSICVHHFFLKEIDEEVTRRFTASTAQRRSGEEPEDQFPNWDSAAMPAA